jgi:uncharacterized repeat protein (TIGR01451 family)
MEDAMKAAHGRIGFAVFIGLALLVVALVALGSWTVTPQRVLAQGPDGQATYYVALSCVGVPSPCFTSVQAAVDAADAADDVIKVAAGLYTGVHAREGVTQVVYLDKTIIIQGGYTVTNWITPDPVMYPTVLSALGQGRVIYIVGTITPTLGGLRLTGGNATGLGGYFDPDTGREYDGGGAVYAAYATPTITNCQVDGSGAEAGGGIAVYQSPLRLYNSSVLTNQAGYGGGLALGRSDAVVEGNLIAGNEANYAGGLGAGESAAQITDNTIRANSAISSGGGIALIGNPPATVEGNLVTENTARWGGGLVISSSTAYVVSNTFSANSSLEVGGGVNLDHCDAQLVGNRVMENHSDQSGGGFYFVASTAVLTGNLIISNTADESGGGLYLNDSQPRLYGNTIHANTADDMGGGLRLRGSAAQLINNVISDNACFGTAWNESGGGGLYVYQSDGALLDGNHIVQNEAVYYGGGAYLRQSTVTLTGNFVATNTVDAQDAWDGGGGGLYLEDSDGAYLGDNTIVANSVGGEGTTAGGGVYLQDSDAVLTHNLILSNAVGTSSSWSSVYGGGVYVGNGSPTLRDNQILSNTALAVGGGPGGGGLYLSYDVGGQVVSNTLMANRSLAGGGAYLQSSAVNLESNRVVSNTATAYGGGLYVGYGENLIQRNTVMSNTAPAGGGSVFYNGEDNLVVNNLFAANHADGSSWVCAGGAAIAIRYDGPPMLHNTIVSNTGTYGVCVNGTATLTNTIVASHTTGVYVQSGSAALESTLWVSNTTDWSGSVTDNRPITGTPDFVNPAAHDYHIGAASVAIDAGVVSGVLDDIDGDPRPADGGYDVGADERPGAALRIAKSASTLVLNPGETFTYTMVVSSVGAAGTTAVVLTDTLPADVQALGAVASQGGCTPGSGWGATVVCALGAVDAGAQAVVTLTVEATTTLPALLPSRLHNAAQVKAAETLSATAEVDVWMQDCHVRLNDDTTDYTSVQAGVDAATQASDVVKVAGACVGVNTLGGLRQQVYVNKTLTIRGGYTTGDWNTSDPVANPTVLDALGLGRVVHVTEAVSPTLDGLTLQNGDAAGLGGNINPWGGAVTDAGGGVYAADTGVTVTNCQVYSSTAVYGGGFYLEGGTVLLAGNYAAGNTAESGGGLYLCRDNAALMANTIAQNTAGNGGGLYLDDSDADLSGNTVISNDGWSGGGFYLFGGAPTLRSNTVLSNTSNGGGGFYAIGDHGVITGNLISSNVSDGSGGGLYHNNSHSDVTSNTIVSNVASSDGGGACLSNSSAQYAGNEFLHNTANNGGGAYVDGDHDSEGAAHFTGNTFTGNTAGGSGGGLRLVMGTNIISGNVMISNTANLGGGAYLQSMIYNSVPLFIQVIGNIAISNTATQNGGGFYVFGPRPYLRDNILRGNTANNDGGGLYVRYQSYEPMVNTVIADNAAGSNGGAVYVYGASPKFLHTTLARNASGSGRAVYLEAYYASGWIYSHPVFTNTILMDSDVGVYAAADNDAVLNGVLWYSVTTHSDGSGVVTVTHAITGDPAFDADGYHLTAASAALDTGIDSGVGTDVDGELRPMGFGFDLGADEYPAPTLLLDKSASANAVDAGAAVTYTLVLRTIGSGTVHAVVLTDTLDAMQQATAATTTQGACTLASGWGGGIVCPVGDMAVGATVTVTLVAQVAPTATLGAQAVNQAVARGDEAGAEDQTAVVIQLCRARINNGTTTYASVQAAVDAANAGDLVKVAGGLCLGATERAGTWQHVYISKTVTLRGGYDTGDWTSYDFAANPTTLDALDQGRVIYIAGSIAPTVEGFHLTGGYAGTSYGGGMRVDTAAATLRDLHIYSNRGYNGGGLYLYYSDATLARSAVYSNTASYNGGGLYAYESDNAQVNGNQIFANTCTAWNGSGGGIYLSYSDMALRGNDIFSNTVPYNGGGVYLQRTFATLSGDRIYGNSAGQDGGGVYLSLTGIPYLTNEVIVDNQAARNGSGVYNSNTLPRIVHATIARNTGGDGAGVYVAVGTSVQMTNTIIVSQTTGVFAADGTAATLDGVLWFSNTANTGGTGSIAVTSAITGNPAFAVDGAEAAHPYHLLAGSAAIDQGLNAGVTEDVDGQPRPMDLGYDLGADEYPGVGLAVVKSAPSLYVPYRQPLTYTIFITSMGTLDATGVVLTDTLDAWQQVSAVTASPGTCSVQTGWGGGAVCDLGTLVSGAMARITLTVQISPDVTLGQAMVNTVDVTANETANGTQTMVYATDCRARINDGTTEYTVLQDAVDAATTGDLIKVLGGTCVGINTQGGYRQVVYLNRQITLRGGYNDDWTTTDPDGNPTILDAQGGGRALYVTGGVSPLLENLRFTGGNAGTLGGASYAGSGGGACVNAATPTFSNTHFLNNTAARGGGLFLQSSGAAVIASRFYSNTASSRGGGLYVYQSAATVNANHFYANTATTDGGGVYLNRSNAVLDANLITENTANGGGGGVYVDTATGPQFYNTVIVDNRAATQGGGMVIGDSTVRLWHTTLARNVYIDGIGVYITHWSGAYSSVVMTNTIIVSQSTGIEVDAGNAATLNGVLWFGNTSNTSGAVTVQNATTGDPAFAADGADAMHPYHLLPGSQAIDRGVVSGVAVDIDGDARPQNGVYDLGADEYVGAAPPPTADFSATPRTGDRPLLVTFSDLSAGSITDWLWRFGDGVTATMATPTHTYTVAGVYTVSLHVTGPGGSDALTRTDYITVTEPGGPVSYTLTIAQTGDGAGALTPGVGVHEYLSGTTVLVTATAQAGSVFEGWSGAATGTTNPASILMDADKVLTATFRALTYTLTVDIVGEGTVTRVPSQTTYLYGDAVTLTATPDAGWYFGQWSGDAGGTLTQTTVTMMANRLVTATFLSTPPTYYTLTMELVGSGVITPAVGAHSYLSGTLVDVSASPAAGWQFAGWTGDLESSASPAQVTMDANKAVTATFTVELHTVYLPLVLRNQ